MVQFETDQKIPVLFKPGGIPEAALCCLNCPIKCPHPHDEFSIFMSQAFERNPDYLKYHNMMTLIIETNVSIEKIAEFKKCSYFEREFVFSSLSQQCSELNKDQITGLFLTILYNGCGLFARTHYTHSYAQAMNLAKLPIVEVDFQASCSQFILICLNYYR